MGLSRSAPKGAPCLGGSAVKVPYPWTVGRGWDDPLGSRMLQSCHCATAPITPKALAGRAADRARVPAGLRCADLAGGVHSVARQVLARCALGGWCPALLALALAALATVYVVAVGAWLWTLRDGISGPDARIGLVVIGAAVLLPWLAGIAGIGWRSNPAPRANRTWPQPCGAVLHLADDPFGILRAGMALQLTSLAVLVLVR